MSFFGPLKLSEKEFRGPKTTLIIKIIKKWIYTALQLHKYYKSCLDNFVQNSKLILDSAPHAYRALVNKSAVAAVRETKD